MIPHIDEEEAPCTDLTPGLLILSLDKGRAIRSLTSPRSLTGKDCPTPKADDAKDFPTSLVMDIIDTEGPVSIKEILAQLDGRFPMDKAVIEGTLNVRSALHAPQYMLTSILEPCRPERSFGRWKTTVQVLEQSQEG